MQPTKHAPVALAQLIYRQQWDTGDEHEDYDKTLKDGDDTKDDVDIPKGNNVSHRSTALHAVLHYMQCCTAASALISC